MLFKFIKNCIKRLVKSCEDWEVASSVCNKSYLENKEFYFKQLRGASPSATTKREKALLHTSGFLY